MILGTLVCSLLGSMLSTKRLNQAGDGFIKAGEGVLAMIVSSVSKCHLESQGVLVMSLHPLAKFEI